MSNYFPTSYEEFIYKSRYSRWIDAENRREDWPETVDRYISYMKSKVTTDAQIPWDDLREAILAFEIMPSMRALMTSGPALERDNTAGITVRTCLWMIPSRSTRRCTFCCVVRE